MKKIILVSSLTLLATLVLNSCKKEETAPSGAYAPLTTNNPSNQRENDCFYIPFTQTGANTWTVNQNGIDMTFTDLHIKSDGRLYGKLASVGSGSGAIIITGGDSYNYREYAVEIPNCSSDYGVTKTIQTVDLPYTLFDVTYGTGSTFVIQNGTTSIGGLFDFLLTSQITTLVSTYHGSHTATLTRYDFGGNTTCNGTRLLIGKLYAKGVVRHPGPNGTETFTYNELGIASMCTADEFVAPLPPPPPPPNLGSAD